MVGEYWFLVRVRDIIVVTRYWIFWDIVHSYVELVGLRSVFESIGLLADDPHLRPSDTLIVAPPSLTPNSWRKFPRLILDLAGISRMLQPQLSEVAHTTLSSTSKYAERKLQQKDLTQRCAVANIDYEPIVFENFGGIERGGLRLLESICK